MEGPDPERKAVKKLDPNRMAMFEPVLKGIAKCDPSSSAPATFDTQSVPAHALGFKDARGGGAVSQKMEVPYKIVSQQVCADSSDECSEDEELIALKLELSREKEEKRRVRLQLEKDTIRAQLKKSSNVVEEMKEEVDARRGAVVPQKMEVPYTILSQQARADSSDECSVDEELIALKLELPRGEEEKQRVRLPLEKDTIYIRSQQKKSSNVDERMKKEGLQREIEPKDHSGRDSQPIISHKQAPEKSYSREQYGELAEGTEKTRKGSPDTNVRSQCSIFQKPTPLLYTDKETQQLVLDGDVVERLSEIDTELYAVSIVGGMRQGKSYLLNRIGGLTKGFPLGHEVGAKTKGIWIYACPHPVHHGQTLLLLDTEGLGDLMEEDFRGK